MDFQTKAITRRAYRKNIAARHSQQAHPAGGSESAGKSTRDEMLYVIEARSGGVARCHQ
jgi:hypothetical protein